MVEYVVYLQKSVSPWLTVWSSPQFTHLSSAFHKNTQSLRWAGVLKLPNHLFWDSIKVLDIFFYNTGISEYVDFSGWAESEGLNHGSVFEAHLESHGRLHLVLPQGSCVFWSPTQGSFAPYEDSHHPCNRNQTSEEFCLNKIIIPSAFFIFILLGFSPYTTCWLPLIPWKLSVCIRVKVYSKDCPQLFVMYCWSMLVAKLTAKIKIIWLILSASGGRENGKRKTKGAT